MKCARFKELKVINLQPFYAVKCNDDPVVLKVLTKLGCGLDVASKAEFVQVFQVSFSWMTFSTNCFNDLPFRNIFA